MQCCNEMDEAIQNSEVIAASLTKTLFINTETTLVEITYCPFCGIKIKQDEKSTLDVVQG